MMQANAENVTAFQFTHPGRGATRPFGFASAPRGCFNSRTPGGVRRICISKIFLNLSFNSRTPGGVRQLVRQQHLLTRSVSIHAPREGCDIHGSAEGSTLEEFQFTHPGRGATSNQFYGRTKDVVSIHAPREGCDRVTERVYSYLLGFNSRTPGGVRLIS